MKKMLFASVTAGVCGLFATAPASAHNTFTSMYAPAGYVHDMELRVTHGCMASPVKEVHVKIPDGLVRVSVGNTRDWKVETKMRKLDKPMPGEGGNMITETVDEIVWKDPTSPMPARGVFEGFKFRAMLPKTPGTVLWFKNFSVCEEGDDKYVDGPKEEINANMPDFAKKLEHFMTTTKGPAAFIVLEQPRRPQYPWEPAMPAKADAGTQQKASAN
jgi:uncharacterized protein YcnI